MVSKLHFPLQAMETLSLPAKKLCSQVNSIHEGSYHPNKEENIKIIYRYTFHNFLNCMWTRKNG